MDYSLIDIAVILVGALAGGFVNGLTGFGTGLTAIPIWIQVLNPAAAAALAAAAGVTGQLQTLHLIRHAIVWRTAVPFVVAGLVGVPIGTWLLPLVDPRSFKIAVGIVLVGYCGFMLLINRLPATWMPARGADPGMRLADLLAGFGGGLMGGLAGLSGPVPIVWTTFKPWTRDQKRGLLQAFNTAILSATVIAIVAAGLVTIQFWYAFLIAVPGTLVGVQLGSVLYRRLDDRRFDRLVMALLLAMGAMLIASNV